MLFRAKGVRWYGTHLNLRVRLVILAWVLATSIIVHRWSSSIVVLGHLSCQKMTIVSIVLDPTLRHSVLSLASIRLRRPHNYTIISVCLDVFLEILRTLERFPAELALVRLQGNVDSDMGSDVVALDRGGSALAPCAGQVEVVGRLAADMALADVLLECLLARDNARR